MKKLLYIYYTLFYYLYEYGNRLHLFLRCFLSIGFLSDMIFYSVAQGCFEQQYTNAIADFRSVHIIQRMAVVAPSGAFYVEAANELGVDAQFFESKLVVPPSFVRRANGEFVVVYASGSSVNLEWQSLNVFASAIRIVPIFEIDNDSTTTSGLISPIVIITACPHKTRILYLDAQPFTVSSAAVGLSSMYENELIVNFRTFEDGIFLFSMANQGDLLVAQITAGRVEAFFDFGSLSRSTLSGGRSLNDGRWHEFRWTHQFDAVQLFIDGVLLNSTTPSGLYRKLDFNHQIEIGGRLEDQYSSDIHTTFHGCLSRVQLNRIDLLQFAPDNIRLCEMPQPQMLSIREGGIVQIAYSFLPFSLEFRVPQIITNNALFSVVDVFNETLLDVNIDEKSGQLILEAENKQIQQASLPAVVVNDGAWHSLSLKLRGGRLDVELDGHIILWLEGAFVRRISAKMTAFRLAAVGCYRSTTVDLRSSAIHEHVFKDKCLFQERCLPNPCRNGGTCVQVDMNSFRCDCDKYYTGRFCQTSMLPRSCEDYRIRRHYRRPATIFPAVNERGETSALIKSLRQFSLPHAAMVHRRDNLESESEVNSSDRSERVIIDLDGGSSLRPFVVFCAISNNTIGKVGKRKSPSIVHTNTFIHTNDNSESSEEMENSITTTIQTETTSTSLDSDTEDEEDDEITFLKNDLPEEGIVVTGTATEPGAIRQKLDYGIDGATLDRFVDGFHNCRQHMRFECRGGTRLMSYGTERRPSTWYATRGGQHGLQWADAPPYSRMCTCALNASCEGNKMCNCDSGRDSVDEGFNRFQPLLPILQLFVGGTSDSSKASARVSIGALRCSGRKVYDTVTFVSKNAQLVDAQTFDSSTFDLYVRLRFAHERMTIFTWESTNSQRWFQLLVRDGRIAGRLVNAGHTHEIVSDVIANDGLWHTVHWEVDIYTMRITVDQDEKSLSSFFLLPVVHNFIIGSQTRRGSAGFAGQMRNLYLAGEEILLTKLVEKLNPAGVRIGESGYCDNGNIARCANDGQCVEMFDRYRCNCSKTPFAGDKCDQEVGMWVPLGSQVSIPWQHPSEATSTCHGISVYTNSSNITLVKARALFAESSFNLTIDVDGHLNVKMYDGFFFMHNDTFAKFIINDGKLKDIKFCATKSEFRLTINEELAILLDGNFTFFQHFNVWNFIDKNFTGCVSRLKVGNGFPLKSRVSSRLSHSPNIKFGSCPYNPLEYHTNDESRKFSDDEEDEGDGTSDIKITAIMKNQQRLLLITPAIGIVMAILVALGLCAFVCYLRSRPDGVYKTNESVIIGSYTPALNTSALNSSAMTASMASAASHPSVEPLIASNSCGIPPVSIVHSNSVAYGTTIASVKNGSVINSKTYLHNSFPYSDQTSLFTKEYFC